MPNKDVHDTSLLVLSAGVVCVGIIKPLKLDTVLFTIVGILLGVFISPDKDLAEHNSFWWRVYGKIFRHRGLSHVPVLGTLTRLIYLGILFFPVLWYFDAWRAIIRPLFLKIYFGLVLADILHVLLDIFVSLFKRRRKVYHGKSRSTKRR